MTWLLAGIGVLLCCAGIWIWASWRVIRESLEKADRDRDLSDW